MREEVQQFLRGLLTITHYGKDDIVVDANSPRIFKIPQKTIKDIKNNNKNLEFLYKDYYNLKKWLYLPDFKKAEYYRNRECAKLSLRVSEVCNLKCVYCFSRGTMVNSGGKEFMSKELARQGLDLFMAYFKKNNVRVVFFGGEPLLNFPLIKDLVSYARSVYGRRDIEFMMPTNGTIADKEIVCWLGKNGIKIGIDLDFPDHEHKVNRPFKNGRSSYDVIKKNIFTFIKYIPRANLNIRSVVRKTSKCGFCDVYTSYYNSGIPVERYNAGVEWGVMPYLQLARRKEAEFEREKVSEMNRQRKIFTQTNNPSSIFKSEIWSEYLDVIIRGKDPLLECDAGWNGISINPIGEIYFCDSCANIKKFILGNIYSGIDQLRLRAMQAKYCSRLEQCLTCWAKGFCYATCPVMRPDKENSLTFCKNFKHNFIRELKFFLSLDDEKKLKVINLAVTLTCDKDNIHNSSSRVKIMLEVYKSLNKANKFIRPVNILPY